MADIELTSGDTGPPVEATILGNDGAPTNLTGSTVYFEILDADTGGVIFSKVAVVLDAENGEVEYRWDAEDTEKSDYYHANFRVVWGERSDSEKVQHYPNDEKLSVMIR